MPLFKETAPPAWPFAKEKPKGWSNEERERILEALGYLPKQLVLDGINGLYRMQKSVNFPNPASGDRNGNMVIYDNAFENGKNLAQILAHEFSHRLYETLNKEQAEDYRFAAGWNNVGEPGSPVFVLTRKKVVTPDSPDSLREDFSNNIEYFLFNKSKLKEASPGAYDWIVKQFGDTFRLGQGR